MTLDDLTGSVIGSAMEVHSELGAGFLEAVYQKSMALEMSRRGIQFDPQAQLDIKYKGESVGFYIPDFYIEDQLVVEIKAVEELLKTHHIQTVNYLAASGNDIGLLINFGATSLQFHRKYSSKLNARPNPKSAQESQN